MLDTFPGKTGYFPCMAYGYLCDHGYPVACEGDLLGLISMIMLSAATQKKSALMDMVQVDPDFNGVVWWHCGIGLLSYADENGMEVKSIPVRLMHRRIRERLEIWCLTNKRRAFSELRMTETDSLL